MQTTNTHRDGAAAGTRLPAARELKASTLRRWARERRAALGLTREQLAAGAGVPQFAVTTLEDAGELVCAEHGRALASLYGVPFLLLEIWTGLVHLGDLHEWKQWESQSRHAAAVS